MLSWRMMRFWYSASVAAHAMLKRMSQNDEAIIVFHECFRDGCRDMRNLSASLDRIAELMHSWGFALREGVFAETKEGICRNKDIHWIGLRLLSGKLPSAGP